MNMYQSHYLRYAPLNTGAWAERGANGVNLFSAFSELGSLDEMLRVLLNLNFENERCCCVFCLGG